MSAESKTGTAVAFVVLGLGVGVGTSTGSVLAGLTVPVGLFVALWSVYHANEGSIGRCWVTACAAASFFLAGMWLSDGRGAWWWVAIWGTVGVFNLLAAVANSHDRDYRHVAAFGVICLAMAAASPFLTGMLHGASAPGLPGDWAADATGALKRAWAWAERFSAAGEASFQQIGSTAWGWVSIVVIAALGWTWARWTGAATAFAAVLAAGGLAGMSGSGAAAKAASWLAAGPVERMAAVLEGQVLAPLSSPAVGIAVLSVGLVLALGGAMRMGLEGQIALAAEHLRRQREGDGSFAEEPFFDAKVARSSFAGLFQLVLLGSTLLSLWLALGRLGASNPVLAAPGWTWDLARPNLSPEFHWQNVVLALVIIGISVGMRGQVKAALNVMGTRTGARAALLFTAALTLASAFFIPGGVMLMGVVMGLAIGVWGRLVTIDQRSALKANVAAIEKARQLEAESALKRILGELIVHNPDAGGRNLEILLGGSSRSREGNGEEDSEEDTPSPPPPPPPRIERRPQPSRRSGAELFRVDEPVLAVTPLIGGGIAVLQEGGGISRWEGGAKTASGSVRVVRPLGLAAAAEGRVVLVEGAGRMVELAFVDAGVRNTHACVTGPTRCFAGKPFGAQVAYAGESPGVSVFVVAEELTREIASDIEGVRALAYSPDGRLLACAADGGIVVLDLKTGSREELDQAGSAVTRLAASTFGWIATLEDKRVVLWGADNSIEAEWKLSGAPTCLAVDPANGAVAVGGSRGHVRVRAGDLRAARFSEQVLQGAVAALTFTDGGEIVAAGKSGVVVRVEM